MNVSSTDLFLHVNLTIIIDEQVGKIIANSTFLFRFILT